MVGTSVDRSPRTPQAGEGGNPWVKETVIGDEEGSCYNSNYYKHNNAVLGELSGNINHSGDYYVCGDKTETEGKCKIVSYDEWITTVKNCKQDPNSRDPCYNMATNSTPGVNDFHMGACSNSQDVYNPENNTGGADGCALSVDGTTPDANGVDDDYETCIASNDADECGIGPVNGVRPAYPTAKGILATVGNRTGSDGMSGSEYTSGDKPLDGSWNDMDDLYECPSTVNVSLSCYADGYGGAGATTGNAPGCGMGDDAPPEGSVKFCKRPTSDYQDNNITKCCLGISGKAVGPDGDTSASFKSCPVGYCRSEVRLDDLRPEQFCEGPVSASKGADGELVCYMMSDKCNDHFNKLCDADVFLDPSHENHGYCNTWALAMPQRFEGKASEVCSIPESESEDGDISDDNSKINTLTKIFRNKLCREWIIRNYDINISKIREICKHAVINKGKRDDGYDLGWELTPLGESLKDICPCHYPNEYYEWYKNDKFNKGEFQSNLGAQIKPECFSPECQRTLLYPTTENPDCPALQICRQSIENNIVSVGERESDSRLGKSSSAMKLPGKIDSQVCNFSNTQAGYNPPPIPTPDGYSGGPDGIFGGSDSTGGGGGGSNNSSGRGGRPKWDDDEEEGDNTMLIVGVTSVVLIFMVIIIVLMMRRQ